jgi:CubicO group peptidase (beta-lactamase class C family)
MAQLMNRRAALAALGALAVGSVLGVGYVIRNIVESPTPGFRRTNGPGGGMMGMSAADMQLYMQMFARHNDISRTVEEIPGGVRTTTESNSPDLAAQLQTHVSGMYNRLGQGSEVTCMSQSLPTLFRNAGGYRRQLTVTPTGVIAEETADDPNLVQAIREHAQEVSGFVRDGMPAMMQGMMGGMMGPR